MSGLLLPIAILVAAAATAALLSFLIARLLLRSGGSSLLDTPGPRSLHAQAVPRAGGLGMVTVLLAAIVALAFREVWPIPWSLSLLAFALVAGIGLLDDFRDLSALLRLAAHVAAACLLVAAVTMGRFPPLPWAMLAVLVLIVAWSVNLHNFMDGIDALLTSQAVWYGLAYAGLYAWAQDPPMLVFALLLAASGLGFLPLNWPRAGIFLGDVGSGTIGLAAGLLAVYGAVTGLISLPVSIVLASAFLVDSTATLALRTVRGERIWQAHRQHLYQRLVLAGQSHGRVVAGYLGWNLLIAAPVAVLLQARDDRSLDWPVAAVVLVLAFGVWVLLRRQCRQRIGTDNPA